MALVKHSETLKNLVWYWCPLCTRLAEYRLSPGEELRLSPGCQSSTALLTRAECRSGAEARNQVSSLVAKEGRHRWPKLMPFDRGSVSLR